MASTTILDFGLPANSHSGANQNRRPGVPAYLEQVVYAAASDDSDPRSPSYELPHLRHQLGDTWIIDRNRPHDPIDSGPFGSPEWRPDTRTGRHRRGELPDPPAAEGRRPSPGRSGNEPPEPPERPRRRFWEDDHEDRYDFGKLREDAWARFIAGSEELHRAHLIARNTFGDRLVLLWLTFRAFLFRVLGIDSAEESAPIEGPTLPLRTVAAPAQAPSVPFLAGTPFQGPHRTNPISPYLSQWERHFDERQVLREAVAL